MQNRRNIFYLIRQIHPLCQTNPEVHSRNNCVQVYWRSRELKKDMSKSKEESIEMPITEAPKKAEGGLGTVEGELQAGEKKKKKNLKKKLQNLKDYDGPRYMQANTWLRRYVRFTKNIPIINTKTIINSRFCFDWCCTDLNRPWPPMAEAQLVRTE